MLRGSAWAVAAIAAMAAMLVAASAAHAQASVTGQDAKPDRPAVDWLRRPTGADFARYYPSRALNTGRSGSAEIRCKTTSQGRLINCVVLGEVPEGYGFGEAAVNLSRYFELGPREGYKGDIGGASVNIPISFSINGNPTPLLSLNDGRRLVLVTTPAKGAPSKSLFDCPSPADPKRRCQSHLMDLRRGASIEQAKATLGKAGLHEGGSVLECRAGVGGALTDCKLGGPGGPAAEAAAREWASSILVADKARDGTPSSQGHVVLEINWAAAAPAVEMAKP